MHSRLAWLSIMAVLVAMLPVAGSAVAETVEFEGSTGIAGISLDAQSATGVEIHYEIGSFTIEPVDIGGQTMQKISLPGVFLPNDAGAPDLPGMGRYIAIPEGSAASVTIVAARTETFTGIEVAPAFVIPQETDDGPLVYEKNRAIYERDTLYPESPVRLSEPGEMRGVDTVILGLTPFQYNPVTRELVVYTELDIRVDFTGGTGQFGEERLRSRWWEPVLAEHLLNFDSLPRVDFTARLMEAAASDRQGWEYIIVTPDNPDFIAWGDTLRAWRKLEGISTECFTTTDIGGTSAAVIEAFLNNAYSTWDPAPAAFLMLGDYPSSGDRDTGLTSPVWNSYCVSDNMYADVNGDDLPDMFHGRITGRNAAELETMIGKMLAYERTPYTDPGFYDHPVIAGGWQTERWFIFCTEICHGHQELVLGKHPVREYAIYSGTPGTVWSSNPNTSIVLNYFGPSGLGYIPSTPQHLTDWGGNATRINNDLNTGAYMMLHRDHGYESGWGEPNYATSNLAGLHNDLYPFVFSINCLTGKYNWASECFTERFHRMGQGAVGLIAASEISYSFVNDTFIWGMWDSMWPDFMPDYGPYDPPSRFATDLRPAMGMANGKHFLQASSWPYNPGDKDVTHHLFHHHGDTFLRMYSEVPTHLAVSHDPVMLIGVSSFTVQADAGAVIALTVGGEIIGVADATGFPQDIAIVPQSMPGDMRVVVTQANRYRYDTLVPIIPPSGPYLVFNGCQVMDATGDDDGILDAGEAPDLMVTLENVGIEGTTSVTGMLVTADPYVAVTTAQAAFPNIPAGGQGTCVAPFVLEVAGNAPDDHVAAFTLTATAAEGEWTSNFALPVQAPVVVAGSISATEETGNGNGRPDPGETVAVTVTMTNIGHSATPALDGQLTTSHPDVTVVTGAATCAPIPIGGDGAMGTFMLEIAPSCPSPEQVLVDLAVSNANGFAAALGYEFSVGPWFDDGEADRGWALGVSGDNASTGIWVREDPVGTVYNGLPVQPEDDHSIDPGIVCFVTGNAPPGAAAGTNDVDGGRTTLATPVFDLTNAVSATLSYWRWYTNDQGNNPGEDYWTVDVTADGNAWTHLEYTQASAAAWNEYTFNLGEHIAFTDHCQVRFIADDSGAGGSLVEAAVDDIMMDVIFQGSASAGPVDVDAVRVANGIVATAPNPFNPNVHITYRVGRTTDVVLKVYDVSGRMVRKLVEDVVEAGEHTVVFDGRNGAGEALSSGVYFLWMETPEIAQVRQLTLLK